MISEPGHMMKSTKVRFEICAIVASVVVAIIYFFDFYKQALGEGNGIECDTFYHIQHVALIFFRGYLPQTTRSYPMFFYIIAGFKLLFNSYTKAVLVYTIIWSFVTNMIQIHFIRSFIIKARESYVIVMGSAISFVWPIVVSGVVAIGSDTDYISVIRNAFLTSGTANPFHNLTSLCVKPFALLCVYIFYKIIDSRGKRENRLSFLLGLVFFLSALAKPNFYQVFAPAGTIITICYFLFHRNELIKCIKIAVSFIPSTIWIVVHMKNNLSPMELAPFVSINLFNSEKTPIIWIIARAVLFVLFVLIVHFVTKTKTDIFYIGIVIYVCGLIEWLLLIIPSSLYLLYTMNLVL